MRDEPLGRAELLRTATGQLAEHHGLLLHGPPGIGRTTVLTALADRAEAGGATVLRCTPTRRDAPLPHLGLIDLLSGLPDARIAALPARPRAALRAALLQDAEPEVDALALRIALTELLTTLASEAPLLLAVDDLQWLDTPTAELLTHLAHRADRIGLRLLAAERTAEGEPPTLLHRCPPDTTVHPVPPLDADAITRLLAGTHPSGPRLHAIRRTAAGNPRYALDLARIPHDLGPAEGLTVPSDLRDLLLHRARRLPASTRRTLLLAAAADHPTLALLHGATATLGEPECAEAVEQAARAGLLDIEADGTVRFRHPVLAPALLSDATLPERIAAHRALAAVVPDPVLRARHLALARREPDEPLAEALTEASGLARRQGAPDRAYQLAALAAARTPAADRTRHRERQLLAAEHACAAGLHDEARRAARPVLGAPHPAASAPDPEQRTRARLVLLECLGQALEGSRTLIREGLAETVGHPELAARLWHWAAARELLGGRTGNAARHAVRAAELGGPTPTGAAVLGLLATVQALRGDPASAVRTVSRARALAAATGAPGTVRAELARRHALIELDEDRPTIARDLLAHADTHVDTHAAPRVDEAGSNLATLLARVRIDVRAGRCADARTAAARCGHPDPDSALGGDRGTEGLPTPALYARALAELAGGEPGRARELAAAAVAGARADGDRIFLVRALEVLARTELLDGSPAAVARAAESLGCACETDTAMELTGAAAVRRRALLAEALILLGDLPAADRTLAAIRDPAVTTAAPPPLAAVPATRPAAAGETMPPPPLAGPLAARHLSAVPVAPPAATDATTTSPTAAPDRALAAVPPEPPAEAASAPAPPASVAVIHPRKAPVPSPVVAVARAEGLLLAALGKPGEGAAALRTVAVRFRERGLPLEAAETLVALATVERRARRRAAARAALAEAAAICALHGAAPLAERVARESARLGAGEAAEGGPAAALTATEHRVADLVAQGATNREVASALFLSVKTVEGTLSRIYRKLGVRSRISLARALSATSP